MLHRWVSVEINVFARKVLKQKRGREMSSKRLILISAILQPVKYFSLGCITLCYAWIFSDEEPKKEGGVRKEHVI